MQKPGGVCQVSFKVYICGIFDLATQHACFLFSPKNECLHLSQKVGMQIATSSDVEERETLKANIC